MDDADKAKEIEVQHRDRAIKQALDKPDRNYGEQPDIVDGVHYCIDCAEVISDERLAIKPDAVRCVWCKTLWENNNA